MPQPIQIRLWSNTSFNRENAYSLSLGEPSIGMENGVNLVEEEEEEEEEEHVTSSAYREFYQAVQSSKTYLLLKKSLLKLTSHLRHYCSERHLHQGIGQTIQYRALEIFSTNFASIKEKMKLQPIHFRSGLCIKR